MAPSILSNSSLLLADAVVNSKKNDFESTLPKKTHNVIKIYTVFFFCELT